jgi:hypothetical protein
MPEASVAPSYVHRVKLCTPGEEIKVGGARLKWYDIGRADERVEPHVRGMARTFVEQLDVPGDLGFVMLHRCGGEGFYFLLVQTWRNENELWESVYAKQSADEPGFSAFALPGLHRGAFCVWELGAVRAEQQAWKRYLVSARDEAAKRAYLDDRFEGAV